MRAVHASRVLRRLSAQPALLQRTPSAPFSTHAARLQSQTTNPHAISQPLSASQIQDLLATPTWDVQELMPSESDIASSSEVTPAQLHHLLRLSALPQPADADAEARMLRDLRAQLHFVKAVQRVDAADVPPLVALRDETTAARDEEAIGLDDLKGALEAEEVVGQYHRRIRRRDVPDSQETIEAEGWDVLGQAPRRVGRFFVVDRDEV